MKKVSIIFIGTGRYLEFLPKYYEQAEANLFPDRPKHYYVFTDGDLGNELPDNVTVYEQEHLQWPYIRPALEKEPWDGLRRPEEQPSLCRFFLELSYRKPPTCIPFQLL